MVQNFDRSTSTCMVTCIVSHGSAFCNSTRDIKSSNFTSFVTKVKPVSSFKLLHQKPFQVWLRKNFRTVSLTLLLHEAEIL